MYYVINITNENVSYETLKSIVGLSMLRIAIKPPNDKPDNPTPRIDLEFIKLVGGVCQPYFSESFYTIRPTDSLESKIIDFLSNGMEEDRPDGETWIERYEGTFTGDPEYKYYPLKNFKEIFNTAFFQRGYRIETAFDEIILAMFSKEDVQESREGSDDGGYVQIPMSSFEIEREEKEELDREMEENRRIAEMDDGYREDPDSWMDDPDNYWNID